MNVELADLTEDNLEQCFNLKVADDQTQYIASNKDSWNAAKENSSVARPFAIYCDGRMVGFVEGFLEKWNNRFRISNICVFDEADRRHGIGASLLERIMVDAVNSGARMAVLETQSFKPYLWSECGDLNSGPLGPEP